MSESEDDYEVIRLTEEARSLAQAVRRMFNAYLAEGFTEAQAIEFCKASIMAANS